MVRKIKAKLVLQLRNQGLSRRAIESAQGMGEFNWSSQHLDHGGVRWAALAHPS